MLAGFLDDETLIGKVLENAALKQVVSSVDGTFGGESIVEKSQPASFTLALLKPVNGNSSDPKVLFDGLVRQIDECYGRDMAKNDVANVLICLTQSYITTFAGLPGTGKTSLVNILAEILGLKNSGAKRFVEVPVEKGWTSYKDFIGYYNPFSKTLENPEFKVFQGDPSREYALSASGKYYVSIGTVKDGSVTIRINALPGVNEMKLTFTPR